MAGASGFVGTSLRVALSGHYRWRALTRSEVTAEGGLMEDNTAWRQCDLYSLPKVQEAIAGTRYGIYLVHSMMPSSRLVQASFRDLDLLLADNFIRAAENAGLEHVIYLGGLLPQDTGRLSPHLESRFEVERILRSRKVPVTVLRAGLICGPGGSSMRILINLVRRLPVMLLPAWTSSRTQSIDIRDVVRAFELVLGERDWWGGTYDLAGHEPTTYGRMIRRTAELMGKPRVTIPVPGNLVTLSCGWVSLVTQTTPALVKPLLESLKYDLRAGTNPLLERLLPEAVPFDQSVRDSIDPKGRALRNPRSRTQKLDRQRMKAQRRVRSVQRMPLPEGWDAPQVAEAYGEWLTRSWLIRVSRDTAGVIRFYWYFPEILLLELEPTPYSRSGGRRRAFYISGGLLRRKVEPPGRLEFRIFPERRCVIAALHGFAPRLPWWVYFWTQALIHLAVMLLFSRFLHRASQA